MVLVRESPVTPRRSAPGPVPEGDRPLRHRRRQHRPGGGARAPHLRGERAGLRHRRGERPCDGAAPRGGAARSEPHAYVRGGGWYSGSRERCTACAGKTLGLLGYGRIAQAFERKMRGFGYRARPRLRPVRRSAAGTSRPPWSRSAGGGLPLTACAADPETRHILVDGAAGAAAADRHRGEHEPRRADRRGGPAPGAGRGRILGAGLDVFENEPPRPGAPAVRAGQRGAVDHIGWYSEEAMRELQLKAAQEAVRVLRGELPRHWLNRW